jgi:ABC-type uncharacterized transport system auxiliary subunit
MSIGQQSHPGKRLSRRKRGVWVSTAALGLTAILAACGDPITATKSWTIQQPKQVDQAKGNIVTDVTVTQQTLTTFYEERCHFLPSTGPANVYCTVFWNSGQRIYVAAGITHTLDGVGTFRSLDGGASPGTLEIQDSGGLFPGDPLHDVMITARPG